MELLKPNSTQRPDTQQTVHAVNAHGESDSLSSCIILNNHCF